MVYRLILFLFLIVFSGCQDDPQRDAYTPLYSTTPPMLTEEPVYIFGVHPLHNPKRLFEVYQPMIHYINSHLKGGKLRLEASRDYASFDKKLDAGYFDFALPNPYQTVMAEDHGYKVFGKAGDDQNFRGIILVRRDSNINSINDLRGKTISYPAPTALAAAIMPQWYLYKHGIDIKKDIKNSYVGSQESSIMNVYLGKSDAAATWPPPWKAFIKERPEIAKEVMIKWETSALLNNGLVARNNIPNEIVKQVAQIITTLQTHEEGRKILNEMELSKYEKADERTYEPVRMFLKKFETQVRPIQDDR